MFQGKRLNATKRSSSQRADEPPRWDMLPRVCISSNGRDEQLKIDLVDVTRHGYSSLLDAWKLSFTVYSLESTKNPSDNAFLKPDVTRVYAKLVSLSQAYENGFVVKQKSTDFTKFLIEVKKNLEN